MTNNKAPSQNKTQPQSGSVEAFLNSLDHQKRRDDSLELAKLIHALTASEPVMWGDKIVGFGSHHYQYDSGREGDTAAVGFAPRKESLVLYGLSPSAHPALVEELGSVKASGGCLHIKDLTAVDLKALSAMIVSAFQQRNSLT